MQAESSTETDRIDVCPNCDREIRIEVEGLTGQHELINKAAAQDEGFMSVTAGTAEIRYHCRCSDVLVEYGPGSASAWDFPDHWKKTVSHEGSNND